MKDIIKFNSISENIIHITLPNKKLLAETLIRFQEHYESPFDDIRGKIFTLGYVRSRGNRQTGLNTYEGGKNFRPDWSGYNFPSSTLEPFIRGLFDPLTSNEKDVVNVLKYKTGSFYVIGTVEGVDPREALEHELCHALYYVNKEYKEQCDNILKDYDLTFFFKWLEKIGYCQDVLLDEAQAYLCADYDHLLSRKEEFEDHPFDIPRECHERLKEVREKISL